MTQSRSTANAARFPSTGCDLERPAIEGFAARTTELDALERAASEALPPQEPLREFRDGPLAMSLPAAFWPARVDGPDYTAYRVRTGRDADLVSLYVGDQPRFHARERGEFRLVQGSTLIRGYLSHEQNRWRIDALALLPCARPRHLLLSAESADVLTIARIARSLRTLHVLSDGHPRQAPIAMDPQRDREQIRTRLSAYPEALALAIAALESNTLTARYPLTTDHPLADQLLTGRSRVTHDGVGVHRWIAIDLRNNGQIELSPTLRTWSTDEPAVLAELRQAQCARAEITLAQDGVAIRCDQEREVRASLATGPVTPSVAREALTRALATRALVARWRSDPAAMFSVPLEACSSAALPIVSTRIPTGTTVRVGQCLLHTDPTLTQSKALALEARCAVTRDAPWATVLRTSGRMDALESPTNVQTSDAGTPPQDSCRFVLGLHGPQTGWVVSANSEESVSAAVSARVGLGVDRRAIERAVGVLVELNALAAGRREGVPEGLAPQVVTTLGLDHLGSEAARATTRWLYAFGGPESGTSLTLVSARVASDTQIELDFMPWIVTVERQSDRSWTVRDVRPTAR